MELDNTESVFKEFFDQAESSDNFTKKMNHIPADVLAVEYLKLLEKYKKLLKASVKMAKIGDRAQKKLIKFKEMVDKIKE